MKEDHIESIVRPLRKSLGLFEAALAIVEDSIAVFTNEDKLTWCNKSFEVFAGEPRMKLLGKTVIDCLSNYSSEIDPGKIYKTAKANNTNIPKIKIEHLKSKQSYIIESHFTRYEENEQVLTLVIKNMTDKYNAQTYEKRAEELAEEVNTCSLTQLYNRRGIMQQIQKTLANKKQSGFYIIFCDVDNFKQVNDTYGHEIGDRALQALADILKKCVRKSDFIGRISGDEFIIGVITKNQDISAPDYIGRRILEEVAKGISFRRTEEKIRIDLSVSLGIADSEDTTSSKSLLQMADEAMYKAKETKSGISFYKKQIKDVDKLRGFIRKVSEEVFRKAAIPFHIQPIMNIQTGKTCGYEVLMRPISSERIIVPTEHFIHAHERNGSIRELDLLLIQSVCNTIPPDFISLDNKFLTINVSAVNIGSKSFFLEFMSILNRSSLDKSQVIVEITETALINNLTFFSKGITYFKDEGIEVFLDDFGAGNTSCNELISLPIGGIKVDSKLFNASKTSPKAFSILRFLFEFGKENDLHVIAEGIESDYDVNHAVNVGCKYLQGFRISPPFPYKYFLKDPEIEKQYQMSCQLSQKTSHPFLYNTFLQQ